jgi:hypothetical protein
MWLGNLWAVMLQVNGGDNNQQAFEEGALRVYIDGESTATGLNTSGTEDGFCVAFNWANQTIPFGTDYCGTTKYTLPGVSTPGAFGSYRIFGAKQPITFSTNLKVTWTAGLARTGNVTNPVALTSLVEYYLNQ